MNVLARRAPKCPGEGDRCAPIAAVIERLVPLRERYGITRIADTTQLDRIGIPTMSAFVPRSADVLGVYSGKGRSRDEALVSTVMEAVERQIGAAYAPFTVNLLPREIESDLDLEDVGYRGPGASPLRCVVGTNLLTGGSVWVPVGLANPFADSAHFSHWTSNGLAAGSSLVEALYHALFEVVERHRWSVAEIEANAFPRFLRAAYDELADLSVATSGHEDDPVASEVLIPTGDPDVDELARAIVAANTRLRLFTLPNSAWPVAMYACLYEPGAEPPMVHAGTGCSWSPRRAAVAAITEAISSRVITIQGAREDLTRARGRDAAHLHGVLRRLPIGRWFFDVPAPEVRFGELPDRATDDFGLDIRRLLEVIRASGLRCVAMVDLSPADGLVHVVRVVAPGLERFTLDGSITQRTKRLLTMSFEA